jgi:hypothetical protein
VVVVVVWKNRAAVFVELRFVVVAYLLKEEKLCDRDQVAQHATVLSFNRGDWKLVVSSTLS